MNFLNNDKDNIFKLNSPKPLFNFNTQLNENNNLEQSNNINKSLFDNPILFKTQTITNTIEPEEKDNELNNKFPGKAFKPIFLNNSSNNLNNSSKQEINLSDSKLSIEENLNISSNLNANKINLEIIEEISSIMREKRNNLKNFEQWNKSYSQRIRLCLLKKTKEKTDDQSDYEEYVNFLIIFSYFDFFIVHCDDFSYMTKLRDELIYAFLLSPELKNLENQKEGDNILKNLTQLKLNLSTCDIKTAILKLNDLIEEIQRKNIDNSKAYIDLFTQWKIFLTKLQSTFKGVNTSEFKQFMNHQKLTCFNDCLDIIQDLNKNKNDQEDYINLINEIFELISGNNVINDINKNNIHLTILSHLIFRYYKNNFINDLVNHLKQNINKFDYDPLMVNTIINIIENSHQNQLEIVQKLKGQYPFLLRFHMIDILNELGVFGQNRDNNFFMREFKAFLNDLCQLGVKYKYFNEYYFWYPSNDEMDEKAKNYSIQYINNLIVNYDKNKIGEFIDEVSEVKEQVSELKNGEITKDEINKIIFEHFYTNKSYEIAISIYFEIIEFQKSYYLNNLNKNDLSSAGDNNISDDDLFFDKILFSLYSETKNFKSGNWKNIYFNLIKNPKIQNSKIDFLMRNIEFILNIEDLNNNENYDKNNINRIIKDFFEYCFIKNFCPPILWIPLLNLIKQTYDKFISFIDSNTLEMNDCSNVLNKVMMYEEIFRDKLSEFDIPKNEIDLDIQNAIDFLFDLKSQNYFPN